VQGLTSVTDRIFHMAVLGRTLEHLGVQMYKRRDTALAELVANCWDANATRVWLSVPQGPDDGDGMSADDVENHYLVVGRNRRRDGGPTDPLVKTSDGAAAAAVSEATVEDPTSSAAAASAPQAEADPRSGPADEVPLPARRVMGRKGIGKLAGFGIATQVELTTWSSGVATTLTLDLGDLKLNDAEMRSIDLVGQIGEIPDDARCPEHGTRIVLRNLKHATAPDMNTLRESLARRFSRSVRGLMMIEVNDHQLGEPAIDWELRVPAAVDGSEPTMAEADLGNGQVVRYSYGFSKTVLASRELRGFTILTHGKTAQAPPFFFDVETTASGQHGTKYMTGTVEADFLDDGSDDESDLVSTDRQEIDWESERTEVLLKWGADLTRKALRDFRDRRAEGAKDRVMANDELRGRLDRLDKPSREGALKLLGNLGLLDHEEPGKELDLASSLIAAFEYRQFHDVVDQIEGADDDPERLQVLLESMSSWKALEGRAILEVIRGRISIIEKFHTMIVNDAPETAHRVGDENLHDLIGSFPWLLHPEWQVLSEERSMSRQLEEWSQADLAAALTDEERRQRYDFLALGDQQRLVLIEIKRPIYAPDLDDIQRLLTYKSRLEQGTDKPIEAVFISSKQFLGKPATLLSMPVSHYSWAEIHDRTKAYYSHYRALLEGDLEDPDFDRKAREVARTRSVLDSGAYRDRATRAAGLGEQDDIRSSLDSSPTSTDS
jgi:hypothetical protein